MGKFQGGRAIGFARTANKIDRLSSKITGCRIQPVDESQTFRLVNELDMPMVWRCSFLDSESGTSTAWKLVKNLESAPQVTNVHLLNLTNEFDDIHWEMMESYGDFDLEVATVFEDAVSNRLDGETRQLPQQTSRI